VIKEAHQRHVEETVLSLEDGPEKFYRACGEQTILPG
jgi:hypothetical protein